MAQADTDDLIIEAAEAIENDEPEKALEIAEGLLARTPRDPDVLGLKADALIELGRIDEAEELLEKAIELHPDEPALLLASADLILQVHYEDFDLVQEAVERAARGEKAALKADDTVLAGHLAWVQGRGFSLVEELRASASALERARKHLGDHPDLLTDLGIAYFECLRFEDAREALDRVLDDAPENPEAQHFQGLIAEMQGDTARAERFFAKARAIDPEEYREPLTLTAEEFDTVIEDALERLPEPVRAKLRDVPILVSDLPKAEELAGDPPLSPLSLGLFRGSAVGDRSVFDAPAEMPAEILLFKKNIERYATDREELVEEIEQTLLHEIGHFVGWDEEDLRKRGLD